MRSPDVGQPQGSSTGLHGFLTTQFFSSYPSFHSVGPSTSAISLINVMIYKVVIVVLGVNLALTHPLYKRRYFILYYYRDIASLETLLVFQLHPIG